MISVKYCGTVGDPSGYGDANRMDICALFTTGTNITVEPLKQMVEKVDYGLEEKICFGLSERNIDYKIKILHITPDMYPRYKEEGKYNIGRLAWETDRLPKEWIAPCNQMDEIWTMSPEMAEMIKASGVTVPIYHFPEPINLHKGFEKHEPLHLRYRKDFYFYSIFQWIDRKNPRGLLRAYWQAFEGNNDVTLIIKTYRMNYMNQEFDLIKQEIEEWKRELGLKHYPKIFLVKKLLTGQEMTKLHLLGDCYVNPSSGEGWCRPMQEAMLQSKPTISGDNGGITDLLPVSYYHKVPSSLQQATENSRIPWYTSDMNWKALDENELSKEMLEVYNNQEKASKLGAKSQKYVIDNFGFQTVGQLMKNRLEEIEKGL